MSVPAPAPAAPPAPQACCNCGHRFAPDPALPRLNYCPACGQETDVRAPRIGELLQQFGGAYFSTEGAFWRTLKLLATKPGELTAQYLAGRRKHYVLPLRLFLTFSVVMLLTLRIAGKIETAEFDDPEVLAALPERFSSLQLELGLGSAGLENGEFYCEGLPPWLCARIQKKLEGDTRQVVLQMQKVGERVANHAGTTVFALLPGFAAGLKLLFRRRRLHYTEHLVFALHLHAFWFAIAALAMAGALAVSEWVLLPLLVVGPGYGLLALKRVYGGAWWSLVLRFALLGAAHLALVTVVVALTTLAALLL